MFISGLWSLSKTHHGNSLNVSLKVLNFNHENNCVWCVCTTGGSWMKSRNSRRERETVWSWWKSRQPGSTKLTAYTTSSVQSRLAYRIHKHTHCLAPFDIDMMRLDIMRDYEILDCVSYIKIFYLYHIKQVNKQIPSYNKNQQNGSLWSICTTGFL